jgi:hypothetical protein
VGLKFFRLTAMPYMVEFARNFERGFC